MAAVNRSAVIAKLHKVLKKHYQPVTPTVERSLLENLLYACCLENSPYAPAESAYQAVSTSFFDWNEVRVTTVKELSEVMKVLPDPQASANNLRRSLQSLFEANYSFDLEAMKKLNLGAAVQKLSSYDGVSPFVVSYVTQFSLGGHSIPLDSGAMGVLAVVGLVDEGAKAKDGCAGLERAIPKNKGVEFGSLLHQIAAEFHANPFSTNLHKVLLEVDPDAKGRLPKRQPKVEKKPEPAPAPAKLMKPDAKVDPKQKPGDAKKPEPPRPEAKADDKKGAKKPAAPPAKSSMPAPSPAAAAKKPASPPPAKKPVPAKKAGAKPPPAIAKRKPR